MIFEYTHEIIDNEKIEIHKLIKKILIQLKFDPFS